MIKVGIGSFMISLGSLFVFLFIILTTNPVHSDGSKGTVRLFDRNFSGQQQLPAGWDELLFDGRKATIYRQVMESGHIVVKAVSAASSSGLIKKISLDPREFPVIRWRWKVSNVYEKGNGKIKEGDDYPARLYITFRYNPERATFPQKIKYNLAKAIYGEYPPLAAINYIWASTLSSGEMVPNAYASENKMIVVESGPTKTGHWQSYTRNIYEDYKKAFGEEPTQITGIAIMTDSDDTGESATAWFGDIILHKVNHQLSSAED